MTQNASPDPSPRIVISAEDLDVAPVTGPPVQSPTPPPSTSLPRLGTSPSPLQVALSASRPASGGGLLLALGATPIKAGLAAGGIGGLLGFFISEIFANPDHQTYTSSAAHARVTVGVWLLLFGLGLGAVIAAWDGLTAGSYEKALRDGAIGAGVGVCCGFVGGYLGQWAYHGILLHMASGYSVNDALGDRIVARTVAWAINGLAVGGGLAVPSLSGKRIWNGLLGGTAGGAAGGLFFEVINSASTATGGFGLRLVGLTLTGVGIGLGIGLVEQVRRDAWIRVTGGPMAGKELILYKTETRVGRDYRNDIVLAKDPTVEPFNAAFTRDPSGGTSVRAGPGTSILVNGRPTTNTRLRSGDIVGIGRSQLTYQERAASPAASTIPGGPSWPASM